MRLEVVDDAPWRRDAACAEPGPDLWFPGRGDSLKPAKRVCAGCLVVDECLAYADELEITSGIWGGMTPNERKERRARLTTENGDVSVTSGSAAG